MFTDMLELKAKPRNELGKKTKVLRRSGFLPAVVYGEGTESKSVAVSTRDFEKVHRQAGETSLVALKVEGSPPLNVMIYDVAHDPLSGRVIHVDFYSVRMDKEIDAKVPLEFVSESPAVKNEGGILVKVIHEIEVRTLPQNMPHEIAVDLARLDKIGGKIYIRDIVLPTGVVLRADSDDVVAVVEAPRSEEELASVKTEAVTEALEVKTEQEIKAEEKAAKAAAEAEAGKD